MNRIIFFVIFWWLSVCSCNSENINSDTYLRYERSVQNSIIDDPKCVEIRELCSNLAAKDDILVIECLQSLNSNMLTKLNEDCQHVVWDHMKVIMSNSYVKEFLRICDKEVQHLNCPVDKMEGSFLKCLANNKDEISDKVCVNLIVRLENVAFNDYRWIGNFLKDCESDIKKLECGRLDVNTFSQSDTIVCLQNKFSNVSGSCRTEVAKLSEIQEDSIKLDRQLYVACAEDQMRYCQQFPPGSGRVFKCLMKYQDERLTPKCQNHLLRRQKLIAQDYRISKGLMRACKEDIKKSHCRRQTSDDRSIRLAQVLVCLEGVVRNGSTVDPNCEAEMRDHRKILMEDYRLSPEIVNGCSKEIKKYCNELQVGGKTIHCLMKIAQPMDTNKKLREVCQRAVRRSCQSNLKLIFCVSVGNVNKGNRCRGRLEGGSCFVQCVQSCRTGSL